MTPDGFWTDGQIRHRIPVTSIISTLARKNRKSVSRSVRSVHALIEPAPPSGDGSSQCAYRIGYLKRVTGAEATSPRRPWAAPCHASPGLGRRATVRVPAASKATPQRLGSPVAGSPPAGLCIPRFWRNPRLRSRPRGVSRYHASRRSAMVSHGARDLSHWGVMPLGTLPSWPVYRRGTKKCRAQVSGPVFSGSDGGRQIALRGAERSALWDEEARCQRQGR